MKRHEDVDSQKRQCNVAVHPGLDLDIDIEVQIESELQRVFAWSSPSRGCSLRDSLGDLADLPKRPTNRVADRAVGLWLH